MSKWKVQDNLNGKWITIFEGQKTKARQFFNARLMQPGERQLLDSNEQQVGHVKLASFEVEFSVEGDRNG